MVLDGLFSGPMLGLGSVRHDVTLRKIHALYASLDKIPIPCYVSYLQGL